MSYQDGMAYSISRSIKGIVSKFVGVGLDGNSVWIHSHDFLETLRDRLLDLLSRKLDKRPRWVEPLRPHRLLVRWKVGKMSRQLPHLCLVSPSRSSDNSRRASSSDNDSSS